MIRVALPNKGQLFEPTIALLQACGYKANKPYKTLSTQDPDNGVEFFFLRPGDIPMYVSKGIIELGITGLDFVAEAGTPLVKILDLPYGKSRHCAAVPNDSDAQELQDLKHFRIATSFPNIVRSYLKEDCPEIIELEGAVEISVNLGVAQAVVDVVETGTTLKQAGLKILGEPLFRSQAALFCHEGKESIAEVEIMKHRIQGKLVAMDYMMIEYDVPRQLLDTACQITPGLDSPTIQNLQDENWFAVKAMVKKKEANQIMDELWKIGCKSILLSSIETARI